MHTVDGAAVLDELGGRDSVLPRGGRGDDVEPGLRPVPWRTMGESMFRSPVDGLMGPAAAVLCECEMGLLGLGKGEV